MVKISVWRSLFNIFGRKFLVCFALWESLLVSREYNTLSSTTLNISING